jgi:hypothetical protein
MMGELVHFANFGQHLRPRTSWRRFLYCSRVSQSEKGFRQVASHDLDANPEAGQSSTMPDPLVGFASYALEFEVAERL